jgi:hypothetical protein
MPAQYWRDLLSFIGDYSIVIYCKLRFRGHVYAFVSKKEQAKKEETRQKDRKITQIKFEFVLSQLFVHA